MHRRGNSSKYGKGSSEYSMKSIRQLAGDTATYGLGSILGRALNYLLFPYHISVFSQREFGEITQLYSYTAVCLVLLLSGMETTYFRFAETKETRQSAYNTGFSFVLLLVGLFVIGVSLFLRPISQAMGFFDHPEYILIMAITVGIDALISLPFASLRLQRKSKRFALLKLLTVGLNIAGNIFFLSVCPYYLNNPLIKGWYHPDFGIGYVFLANLISSLFLLVLFIPKLRDVRLSLSKRQLRSMLAYALPILGVGIVGGLNQHVEKMILIPHLIPEEMEPKTQLGIYAATLKLSVLLALFIQAFRFAFEPFFFSRKGDKNSLRVYAAALEWLLAVGGGVFLAILLGKELFMWLFLKPSYYAGLDVLPMVLLAQLLLGIYFSLSLWYKLTDRTLWGFWFALAGMGVTIFVNIVWLPSYGYHASAVAFLSSSALMSALSLFFGQKFFPIPYRWGKLFLLSSLIAGIYTLHTLLPADGGGLVWMAKGSMGIVYCVVAYLLVKTKQAKEPTTHSLN